MIYTLVTLLNLEKNCAIDNGYNYMYSPHYSAEFINATVTYRLSSLLFPLTSSSEQRCHLARFSQRLAPAPSENRQGLRWQMSSSTAVADSYDQRRMHKRLFWTPVYSLIEQEERVLSHSTAVTN